TRSGLHPDTPLLYEHPDASLAGIALLWRSGIGARTHGQVPWPSAEEEPRPRPEPTQREGRNMSEAIRQPGGAALPRPLGIGEILSTAFQLYQRYWRTLLAIAAVVVVPFTLLQYLLGHTVRVTGMATSNGVVVTT